MAEEVLDLRVRIAFENGVLDDLDQDLADDSGQHRRDRRQPDEALEGFTIGKEGGLPLLPEIDDHREHGARVQHDQQQGHRR